MERLLEWSGYFLHSVLKTAVSWSSGNEQDAWKRLLDLYDKEVKKKKPKKLKLGWWDSTCPNMAKSESELGW